MSVRTLSLALLLCLLGGLQVLGQEIDPDVEVLPSTPDGTVIVPESVPVPDDAVVVAAPALPEINVNTNNVVHNNIPGPSVVEVPAPAAQVVTVPTVVPAVTAAPTVVNPVVPNPTVVNPTATTGMRYGVGVVPLGSLLMGGGLGTMGLGTMGLGTMGLGAAMMPRLMIGR
ncbi:Interleukin-15 receptor subunit alpha [Frankliniella fusca]|uniref:Interleukin-15 receptor subunit alpha n=1 Tax=Frankliniella fusca TaxID=407009 RepID=A0AAE1HJV6_9NEOP|nr:Interleukin-15 receptor subunit alpha [Frankliniella fusca]